MIKKKKKEKKEIKENQEENMKEDPTWKKKSHKDSLIKNLLNKY